MAKKKKKKKGYSIGYYPYKEKDKKKSKKKDAEKQKRKADKKLKMQCTCNHIARNDGKKHIKKVTIDGIRYNVCKICGGRMIADTNELTRPALAYAAEQLNTVIDLGRNKLSISPEYDKQLIKVKYFNAKVTELYDEIVESKAKKKKKKNNKKRSKKKGKRLDY